MTEVRRKCTDRNGNHTNHSGLFATRTYAAGDVILVESSPLIQLSPVFLSQDEQEWIDQIADQKQTSFIGSSDSITFSKEVDSNNARFKAMVQVGLCFVLHVAESELAWKDDPNISDLRQLYHPPTSISEQVCQEEENAIAELSARAFQFVQNALYSLSVKVDSKSNETPFSAQLKEAIIALSTDSIPGVNSDWKLHPIVQEMMLIWACNAFQGGRIYRTFSRINHSCNPNAVVVVLNDECNAEDPQCHRQKLVASSEISVDEEILISYLNGPLLYAIHVTRKKILLEDKYFVCSCDRCSSTVDLAGAIPCPVCYARESQNPGNPDGVLLPEDVQYDDDQDVRYVYPMVHDPTIPAWSECPVCYTAYDTNLKPPAYAKLYQTHQAIVDKVVSFLRRPNILDSLMAGRPNPNRSSHESAARREQEEEESEASMLVHTEQLEQLLSMSSSVLGAKHWTTNMLLLLQLNQTLTQFNARTILNATNPDRASDDEDDAETTIAEAIDMLERVVRFVEGIQLKLHVGHLLSNVIVGTARALVSLGDVKSQKYAAKWLDKIMVYVNQFESPGVQAVVHSLHVAWQRSSEEGRRPEKRSKR